MAWAFGAVIHLSLCWHWLESCYVLEDLIWDNRLILYRNVGLKLKRATWAFTACITHLCLNIQADTCFLCFFFFFWPWVFFTLACFSYRCTTHMYKKGTVKNSQTMDLVLVPSVIAMSKVHKTPAGLIFNTHVNWDVSGKLWSSVWY